ncbi:hypothetical protein CWS35_23230 [Bradyrhizobium sp. SK17]|uniref:hypothetical protein n=1 Tax=Bradyrhizobium sp. SK17 TaxID=2057741 RepID=UPI000C3135F4|nr:hypothetical protein [Bradyrhizobium sp. SK17]AUC96834.1 hypothetical protein CWS35_23230 [Bradyrhizobium sp. SK17]
MWRTVRNVLDGVQILPFAVTACVAITAAFVALMGALLGSPEVMEFGKAAAGFGALGFFVWLFLMIVIRSG